MYIGTIHARLTAAALAAGVDDDTVVGVEPGDVLIANAVALARRCGISYREVFATRSSA